jgi:hypothetical protein
LLTLSEHKKAAGGIGGGRVRAGSAALASEAHHAGHGVGVGIEACVELGVVVLDGRGGVLEAVAREDSHHRGTGGHLLAALDQAGH